MPFAGLLIVTICSEMVTLVRAPISGSHRALAFALAAAVPVLAELDVFHPVHTNGWSTHVTGTHIHLALRCAVYHCGCLCAGAPAATLAARGPVAAHLLFIAYSAAATVAHRCGADLLWGAWRIGERRPQRPTPREHVIGLAASFGFIALYACSIGRVL